jgi:hypothetical protein
MKLPTQLLSKTLARFDSLVAEGKNILGNGDTQPDFERVVEWRTKAVTLLDNVIPHGHVHRKLVEEASKLPDDRKMIQGMVSALRALKDDLDKGFLDSMARHIEAEIAADYMGQAEALMAEGKRGNYDHVPAAVLAGAVMEKALRTLCQSQDPPIPTILSGGLPKGQTQMIDELERTGVFTVATSVQLKGWAKIRNLAAHGEFGQFSAPDVKFMLEGINGFIARHLA